MDNPQECSEIIAYMEMQFKSEKALVDYISKIKAVSSENIIEAANAYLDEDCLSTVILKPKKVVFPDRYESVLKSMLLRCRLADYSAAVKGCPEIHLWEPKPHSA